MKKQQSYSSFLAYALALLAGLCGTAQAAPGNLAQQPLFLQTSVTPNVFFLTDDSGSMQYELQTRDARSRMEGRLKEDSDTLEPAFTHNETCSFPPGASASKIEASYRARLYAFILEMGDYTAPCGYTVAEEEWRARFYEYNTLYYNPNRTYQHWDGTDSNGVAFKDAKITEAPLNPADPDGPTIDLTKDSAVLVDGKRTYYDTEAWRNWCSENAPTATCEGWRYYIKDTNGNLTIKWVNALSDAEKTNFANWFTYHRKREYVAKYAISKVITETKGVRMGFAGINNNGDNRVEIQAANADKSTLISAVQNTVSTYITPLVGALKDVGDYYKDHNFFGETNAADPILPAPDGTCQINNTILMTDGYYDGPSPETLASVAATYYDTDFRSDLPGTQNMNTYAVAFGVTGTLDPYGTKTPDDPSDTDPNNAAFSWPAPSSSDAAKIDDLWHATVNGHGKFLSANDSSQLVDALSSAISDITGRVQSANSVATASFQMSENTPIYISRFSSSTWSGELLAYTIDGQGKLSAPLWNAATELDKEDNTSRQIITFNGATNTGVKFLWNDISNAMQNDLTAGDTAAGIGQARLTYLRGKRSDSFTFRQRTSLLGDIVNATPVYVGAPASLYPDTAPFGAANDRYYNFWDSNKGRDPVIYVGANDGMLHAFDAASGAERFAYVPETVYTNLADLTRPDYSHHYFVDQTPSVSDVYLNNHWRTVLVGGLGAGGRGIYALDITDPNRFDEAYAAERVLWEFNSGDDSNLGYTFSKPVIALTRDGNQSRWTAIVGNGYNSDSGVASLFIIYLDADLSDGWTLNSDYRIITTKAGSANDKNGLSSPAAVDTDGDGYVERIYAGDLQGNMWAFDQDADNNWQVAYGTGDAPAPLFTATDGDSIPQPITAKPSIIRHPFQPTLTSTTPNLMVLFGTGQYLTRNDLSDTQTQSFYGVWDSNSNSTPLSRDDLVNDIITSGQDVNNTSITARITTPSEPVQYGQSSGWYIDLAPDADSVGERVISNAVVINNTVFFSTYIPNDGCNSGGSSWFMFVNAADGGFPNEPVININNDLVVDANDLVTLNQNADATAPSGLLIEGSLGTPTISFGSGQNGSVLLNTEDGIISRAANLGANDILGKRISWRELRTE